MANQLIAELPYEALVSWAGHEVASLCHRHWYMSTAGGTSLGDRSPPAIFEPEELELMYANWLSTYLMWIKRAGILSMVLIELFGPDPGHIQGGLVFRMSRVHTNTE